MSGRGVKAGDSISIYWDGDKKWYYGQVVSYDEAANSCLVLYDDGEKEVVNLNVDKFKIHNSKKDVSRSASSGNKQWKVLKDTLFDIADRLPYKGVHVTKSDWWEKWKSKVLSASESKNAVAMSFSIIEISRQLKGNVSTEWWKAQKKAWEKETVDANTVIKLASCVNDLLTNAVNWAYARQLFDDASSQTASLIQSAAALEAPAPEAVSKPNRSQTDGVKLDETEQKTPATASSRRTRRSTHLEEPEAASPQRNLRASKKSKVSTSEEIGLDDQKPSLGKEVAMEDLETPTNVLPSNLSQDVHHEHEDRSSVATAESLGMEEEGSKFNKTSEKEGMNGARIMDEPSHEGAADSSAQHISTLAANADANVQKEDTVDTIDLKMNSSCSGMKEAIEPNKLEGVSKLQSETSAVGREIPPITRQNLISEDRYEFLKAKYAQDKTFMKAYNLLHKKKSELTSGQASYISDYSFQDGLLFFKNKLCIINDDGFRKELIQKSHLTSCHEHLDSDVTCQLLERSFFWSNMRKDVQKYIGSCATCCDPAQRISRNENLRVNPELLKTPWQSVILKFIDGIPSSLAGHDCILVLVDRMSKQAHFVACKKTFTAVEMAHLYFADIVRLHGLPKFILSDDTSIFKSDSWISLWEKLGTTIDLSLIQVAEKDSEVEKVDKILEDLLRSYVASQQEQWQENLHLAEFIYNNSKFPSTGISPFEAIYGYDFQVPSPFQAVVKNADKISDFIIGTINLLHVIQRNFSRLTEKPIVTNGSSDVLEMVQPSEEQPSLSKDVANIEQASPRHARKGKQLGHAKSHARRS